jgi:SAM-dependent methyltransferase
MKTQVEPGHYFSSAYDTKERFCSYWHQIHEIIQLKPGEVLEIGTGNGFVSKFLKERGVNILTFDIDSKLKPDFVGSALYLPFQNKSFDVIVCCEVLEHLPYEDACKTLSEIGRVTRHSVILSLPDANYFYRIYIHVPKIKEIKKLVPLPRIKTPIHKFNGEHYWEIGKAGYPLKKIITDIQTPQLRLERTFRVYEIPYHRFFILRKTG